MAVTRAYNTAYLWAIRDPDTIGVLVPLGESEYETFRVIWIRIENLRAPEKTTPEGRRLLEEIRERLFTRWQEVSVQRYGKTFDRYVGTIRFPDGSWWRDKVLEIMEELGIEEGGM